MRDFVSILDGNSFAVSDETGDIELSRNRPTGIFAFDTRFISTWVLTINGQRLYALSTDDLQYFETRFYLVPGEPGYHLDAKVSLIRERQISGSVTEKLTVLNHEGSESVNTVRLEVSSDFADIFEIKEANIHRTGRVSVSTDDGRLTLIYERGKFRRTTVISTTEPAQVDESGLTWVIPMEPGGEWSTHIRVDTLVESARGQPTEFSIQKHAQQTMARMARDLNEWVSGAPRLVCDSAALSGSYERSLVDLAALQYVPLSLKGNPVLAAGLPWFMTMFGRDSIITSLQTLPFFPHLAAGTLRFLALNQGSRLDDFRDEEPGKILHEVRYGESTAFEERPHTAYSGAADTTPLFVILLDEYERWSGDVELVRDLEHHARLALEWIDTYADIMGNGYIWYQTRNPQLGLENQCWKDSWDSISYRDGRIPALPRATCEAQGYAYDAKLRGARLARTFWNDPAWADQLESQAEDLKRRFNRDFWVEDGEYYALGLDREGDQVDALSSNMGHLLWSGIVEPDRAGRIVEQLVKQPLFSGWGVRTLAKGQGRYNPLGYHVGTVWPFDNSIIAWGMRRYGYRSEAALIARSIIDSAPFFSHRLPEAFAGYDRKLTVHPVEYPSACSPQAWSAGAPLLFLRTLLGLEPSGQHLVVDPSLPEEIGRIELLDIPGRWGRMDALGRPDVSRKR